MLVPCNLLAQRVRPWSVLGSSGVRTGVFGSPLPVSSSCEYTKRRRSFVMVSIEAHSMGSPIRLRFGLISPYARVRCENKQRGHRDDDGAPAAGSLQRVRQHRKGARAMGHYSPTGAPIYPLPRHISTLGGARASAGGARGAARAPKQLSKFPMISSRLALSLAAPGAGAATSRPAWRLPTLIGSGYA